MYAHTVYDDDVESRKVDEMTDHADWMRGYLDADAAVRWNDEHADAPVALHAPILASDEYRAGWCEGRTEAQVDLATTTKGG